jgi:hypothetical protein
MADGHTSRKISILGLVASGSGFIAEIASNTGKTIESVHNHFFVLFPVLWVATVIFVWTTPLGPSRIARSRRWALTLIASSCAIAILGWRSYQWFEHSKRITHPASPPDIRLPGLIVLPVVKAAENKLALDSFYLNQDLSSFWETRDHKFGDGPLVPTYVVDLNVYEAFKKGACTGVEGDKPAEATVPVLREFWSKHGRDDLAAYLTAPTSLGRLIRERGDIFADLIPTPEQLSGMSAADYGIVRTWIHDCVGLYNPVFTFVISNRSDSDLILTTIIYHVLDVGQVKGGLGGPIYPLKTYDYELQWRRGDQEERLSPPLQLPAKGHVSFNLRLHPGSQVHGLSWWMNIEARDSAGDSVSTEMFELTMNKQTAK